MSKFVVILFLLVFSMVVSANNSVVFVSKSGTPQINYMTKATSRYRNKDTLIVKSKDFVILALKEMEEGETIVWRTSKIKVLNQNAVESWPLEIKNIISKLIYDEESKTKFDGSVFANPISFAVLNSQRDVNLGWGISSTGSEKHEFSHDFTYTYFQNIDEFSESKTQTMNLVSNIVYDYNEFYGNWTYFAILNYQRSKYNDVYSIKHQLGAGLIGLKYSFIKDGKYFRRLNISYVPMIESVSSDENIALPGEEPSKEIIQIRNSFRFKAELKLGEWDFNYSLFYRPAYNYKAKVLDMKDINTVSEFSLSKPVSDNLSIRYTNTYTYDIRQFRSSGIRPDNTINAFFLEYSFAL